MIPIDYHEVVVGHREYMDMYSEVGAGHILFGYLQCSICS